MYSIYSIFYYKFERITHLFFKFANVRGTGEGNEMFLFTNEYGLEINDVFLNINAINILLKNKFSDIYKLTIPIEILDVIDNTNCQQDDQQDDQQDEITPVETKITTEQQLLDIQTMKYKSSSCKYECKICNATFSKLCNYEKHLNNKTTCDPIKREQQNIDKLTCHKCKKVLSSTARLKGHLEICKIELTQQDMFKQMIDNLTKQNEILVENMNKQTTQLNKQINKQSIQLNKQQTQLNKLMTK